MDLDAILLFRLMLGEHPLFRLAAAGLPDPDPERGTLRYGEWIQGEVACIETTDAS